jgi:hypothetical protein
MGDKQLLDVHVHLAALPVAGNGCYVSPQLLSKWMTKALLKRLGIDPSDPVAGNRRYLDKLVQYLQTSRWVRQAVLLALDGAYDSSGRLDTARTHFVIANDLVFEVCRAHPEFLPGISINPLRRDAVAELDRCVALGAALVKFLPNTQGFDPADPRCRPFYRRMAECRLPLLSHSGYEFTLVGVDQSLGDPGKMQLALEEGVTVIAAHGGSTGVFFWERHYGTVRRLIRRYPHYNLDSSALCLPNRALMALRVLRSEEMQNRLLYGSDYPVPVYASPFLPQLGRARVRALAEIANPLDKNAAIQTELGLRFAALPAGSLLAKRAAVLGGTP